MKSIRTYSAYLLWILFGCYYLSISLFSHAHIVGGDSDHNHSDSQYAVIDILSQFQSESAAGSCNAVSPFYLISEICTAYREAAHVCPVQNTNLLRGPPQA